MNKLSQQFVCVNCAFTASKWQGKCSGCGAWNSLEARTIAFSSGSSSKVGTLTELISLKNLTTHQLARLDTGFNEFNEVLGGGLVAGSLVLLGGDPGIGKSTLALETAINLVAGGVKVIYVAGEESPYQIKTREQRLGKTQDLNVLAETNLEIILAQLALHNPKVVIIDSIQTIYSEESSGVTGGVSQIVYVTNALMRFAKQTNTTIIIIGHVTKEGVLAGPKTLEHMVDAVLYLEGERFGVLRVLRCIKNRFGSVGEVGVFEMTSVGLKAIANPSGLFLGEMSLGSPGSAVACVLEGNKVLLVEVQALVNKTAFGYPKRTASGFDANRLQLILAILEKHLNLPLNNYDVYINVTGGFKLDERSADLPIALAVVSSLKNLALPSKTVAFGELGLSGEVRGVVQIQKRIKECKKLGFSNLLFGYVATEANSKPEGRIIKKVQELVVCLSSVRIWSGQKKEP